MLGIMLPVCILAGTVVGCEILAGLVHRHVMHGFGWVLHRSHHQPRGGWFEANDLFAVMFAAPAVVLLVRPWGPASWIGIGLCVYGALYFVMHDGLVHQRWPFRAVPRRGYLKHLYQAHKLHHAVEGRDHAVSFGFLYAAPLVRLRGELRRTETGAQPADRATGS